MSRCFQRTCDLRIGNSEGRPVKITASPDVVQDYHIGRHNFVQNLFSRKKTDRFRMREGMISHRVAFGDNALKYFGMFLYLFANAEESRFGIGILKCLEDFWRKLSRTVIECDGDFIGSRIISCISRYV